VSSSVKPENQIEETLLEARLLRRYKRFLADVEMEGESEPVTVHCPNPGSMLGVASEGSTIWLRRARNPNAKLKYGWVLSEVDGGYVSVDTLLANKLFDLAIKAKHFPELIGYGQILKEQTFRQSRFDFLLGEHKSKQNCYVEVKSTTLAAGDIAMFPDAKTERGRKHLDHLVLCKEEGFRAVQFFCVCRSDTSIFKPADHIDKLYGEALRRAAASGVELLAYSVKITRREQTFEFSMDSALQVVLQ